MGEPCKICYYGLEIAIYELILILCGTRESLVRQRVIGCWKSAGNYEKDYQCNEKI